MSGVKFVPDILVRHLNTIPQVKLKGKERRDNLKGAFIINKKHKTSIEDKNVVIVDDVMTTGATVMGCLKVLKENGVGNVYILTAGRTIKYPTS